MIELSEDTLFEDLTMVPKGKCLIKSSFPFVNEYSRTVRLY